MTLDEYGLELARAASLRSKDPSTRVGCAILRLDGTVASVGYNGAPRGVDDIHWMHGPRDRKLAVTLHAEINAVLNSRDPSMSGCTAYVWPLPVCSHCAAVLIQSGVSRVVCAPPDGRWSESAEMALALFEDANTEVVWRSL